eukprot:TRINITY_DN2398_c0_g1_i26.p1 TRINITY_DN2398_c0_g1~~TRINITY_DN2398_c0_g1_i26.p1  ORF type:complete len:537 (-),score=135.03 TRINITY_DN2398_c0_g1_i26:109-1719(-)
MGELLFECYNVPRVGFGVDALFSYYYHKRNSLESLPIESALVLRSGNVTSHVLPIVEGKCRARNILRVDVGGRHVTNLLHQVLQLDYPHVKMTYPFANSIKEKHCYVASDYSLELSAWKCHLRRIPNTLGRVMEPKIVQFPFTPSTKVLPKDDKELEKKKHEKVERMKLMAQDKRLKKIEALKEEREYIEKLFKLKEQDFDEYQAIIEEEGFTEEDLLDHLQKTDKMLCVQQSKKETGHHEEILPEENKRQLFLKTMSKSRQVQQAKKELKMQKQLEECKMIREQIEADPHGWYQHIMQQIQTYKQAVARKQQISASRLGGRQTVKSVARMKALAKVEEEGFGDRDEDWDKYLEIEKGETEKIEELEKIEKLENLLVKYWPPENWSSESHTNHYSLEAMANQLHLSTCLTRCAEVTFQPSLIGMDQMGLMEAADYCLKGIPEPHASQMLRRVYLTGGNTCFQGFKDRVLVELTQVRPVGDLICVTSAEDPILDSWKGAALFCTRNDPTEYFITRKKYDEYGSNYFKLPLHFASNII